MPNIQNINRLIARLRLDDGRHFKMLDFMIVPEDDDALPLSIIDSPKSIHTCNTAFCVAGWANAIAMRDRGINETLGDIYRGKVNDWDEAQDWLGLTNAQAADLFMLANSAISLGEFDKFPHDVRQRAAILVLEHLRESGEVDWDRAIQLAQQKPLPASLTDLLTVDVPA
jgi:hypothetical protein